MSNEIEDDGVAAAKAEVHDILHRIVQRGASAEHVQREYPDEIRRNLEAEAARSQEERRANVRKARLEKWDSKIPAVFRGWTLDRIEDLLQREALEWISKGYGRGQNIVASGGTGAGKSTLAYAISREIYGEGYKAKMWRAPDLIAALNPKAPAGAHTLESVKNCDLLTIDDLGAENRSDWTAERLLNILDHRWQWGKPTIITTNLPFDDDEAPDGYTGQTLAGHIGDRAMSRISGNCIWLQLVDGDKRG